jgi:DNA-binding winged helix-turn-helix (wHTH) protein
MALLVDSAGQVLPREEIYHRVWGYTMAHGDRSVDVYVGKVRQKLERASPNWRYIHTHFGIGYRFAPEPAAPLPAPLAATLSGAEQRIKVTDGEADRRPLARV